MRGEELEDWLAEAIDDSLDMDWTGRVGARSIMRQMEEEGLSLDATAKPFWQWAEEFKALGFGITRYELVDGDRLVRRYIASHPDVKSPLDLVEQHDMAMVRLLASPLPEAEGLQRMLEMAASAMGRTV